MKTIHYEYEHALNQKYLCTKKNTDVFQNSTIKITMINGKYLFIPLQLNNLL